MRERKGEKPKAFQEYDRVITEIQATRGRNAEHFIKIFRHENDNVAGASLGVLLGVFEIDDQSEDSKYIVNFLFSVAKNEYFCNPRRGAMESFEAALHKINVALAEIVKHGNIDWLGKFHGTIAIIEKNSIHLSATGDGRIYLFRNGTLSHISEGLASPDAAEHPIKTFIEISSGRLAPDDRLLFFLPQVFSLLDEETIERQAQRMDKDRFAQFLRTAMINELDRSGAIIVDITEPSESARAKAEAPERQRPEIKSYFSEAAFEAKHQESIAAALSEESPHHASGTSEYTDTKTGHIYVQGDENSTPIETSRFAEYLEDFFHSSRVIREQGTRAMRRSFRNFSDRSRLFCVASAERCRQISVGFFKKHLRSRRPGATESIATLEPVAVLQKQPVPQTPPHHPTDTPRLPLSSAAIPATPGSPRIKASFSQFSQTSGRIAAKTAPLFRRALASLQTVAGMIVSWLRTWIPRLSSQIVRSIRPALSHIVRLFQRLPFKARIGVLLLSTASIATFFWIMARPDTSEPAPTSEPETNLSEVEPTASIRSTETLAADLPALRLLSEHADTIAIASLNDTLVIATRTTIEIPSLAISAVLPAESGAVRAIAPMPDLRTLFILTESGKLLSFTPSNTTFTENTLPTDTHSIQAIGAYLTYLYALDGNSGQIYRFPRAQGGFSEGLAWLKPSIAPDREATFAVNDMVSLFAHGSLRQFSRGKEVRTFEMPNVPLQTLLLASEPDNTRIVGLDNQNHRLVIWNTEGAIEQQYFSDRLADIRSLSLHGPVVSLSTDTAVFELILP
ncbi:MAG: hypothetical protein KA731_03520 [Candidatus Moranbacteria bacterium]|nr:hypothetical protein [Candidatus Moranbacteria bacterium]MBP6034282.1 hypothetical protein [Candidatus Moranbacteria bacterium]MBP7695892.1 hypothetical protein [Candidatus Moranbacteria bacterium]